jgi:cytochrome c oxidase assembly protein subunit 15
MKAEDGAHVSSHWPHRLAVVTAYSTVALLFIGGLVTSTGAGLAVPDWPTSFGYSMFLYPWSKMVGLIFYEHSHRLIASAVGLLTIFTVFTFWMNEQRKWLRWLAVVALGLVIIQGVFGGLRVVLLQHNLAIVHACFAQAFFALIVSLAIFTSAEWNEKAPSDSGTDDCRLWRLCAITAVLIYVQSVFGAVLRHTGERLDGHLVFAVLVTVHVALTVMKVMRFHSDRATLVRPALLFASLLLLQLILGIGAYFGKFTSLVPLPHEVLVFLTTMHVVVGALLLGTSVVLTLRSWRFSTPATAVSRQHPLVEQYPA